jgi:hypothetical protein
MIPKYSISKLPSPLKIFKLIFKPKEPFVMVNVISYKEKASGKFSHFSGEEAYKIYADTVVKSQGPMGSKVLWAGRINKQLDGPKLPDFDTFLLLQYASPRTFLKFVFKGGSNTKARMAGLKGQWLLASNTIKSNETSSILEEKFALIEYFCYSRIDEISHNKGIYQHLNDSNLIWFGKTDQHILGSASPKITHIMVSLFETNELREIWVRKSREFTQSDKKFNSYLSISASNLPDAMKELR